MEGRGSSPKSCPRSLSLACWGCKTRREQGDGISPAGGITPSQSPSSRSLPGQLPLVLLLSVTPRVEHPVGQLGSALLALSPPQLPVHPQPLTGGAAPGAVKSSAQCKHRSSTAKTSGCYQRSFPPKSPMQPHPSY